MRSASQMAGDGLFDAFYTQMTAIEVSKIQFKLVGSGRLHSERGLAKKKSPSLTDLDTQSLQTCARAEPGAAAQL